MKGFLSAQRVMRLTFVVFLLNFTPVIAQSKFFETFSNKDKLPQAVEKTQNIRKISIIQLDETALRKYLQTSPLEFHNGGVTLPLEIPLPNGTSETFGMVESPVLSPEQAALHPEIKTYTGNGLKNKKYIVRLSLTSSGFNAIILNVEDDAVYFEPYSKADRNLYFSYFSKDAFIPKDQRHLGDGCGVGSLRRANGSVDISSKTLQPDNAVLNNTGAMLRTYRLAVASTAEFTNGHAGANDAEKKTATFNDITAYVNRMNAVYRNEICVTFQLVSGESVVYTVPGTPYTNSNTGTMLDQNQTTLDAVVMTANYDVGHVIGQTTDSGDGVAIAQGCDASGKAKGATRIGGAPFAQVFFDQTLFHEVGHQFGMSHSYNSSIPVCTTRNAPTSAEPGAGATIMSYGFTCGGDDYFSSTTNGPILVFHTVNYSEMVTYMASNGCGALTATMNNLPVVPQPANYNIPKSTPFELTGSATDINNDALTYSWEGTNIGTETPDAATLANTAKPPFFRTYEPTTIATRTFPLLSSIIDGTNYKIGDKLPSVAIATTHRLTVRDNRAGGGSTVFKDVTVTVDGSSGPFLETTNLAATYMGNSNQAITWSVNNTTSAPISCANVKISISTDGGTTFPTVLLASTPNDGTENITLPNVATTTARIKVEAVGNVFFDISNTDFTITAVLPVELLDFQAKAAGKSNQLVWRTASEKNNYGFEIERSVDGQTFYKIGFVKGFGTVQTTQYYTMTDAQPLNIRNYYRLKQLDTDGAIAYSKIVSVINKAGKVLRVYPTLVSNGILTLDTEGVDFAIYNLLGQQVQTGKVSQQIDVSALTKGTYIIKVGEEQAKFMKQ